MILSRGAVSSMVQRGVKCPSPDHPDDMFLGSTARYYKINVVFSPLYHQVGCHGNQSGCHYQCFTCIILVRIICIAQPRTVETTAEVSMCPLLVAYFPDRTSPGATQPRVCNFRSQYPSTVTVQMIPIPSMTPTSRSHPHSHPRRRGRGRSPSRHSHVGHVATATPPVGHVCCPCWRTKS